ncbi:MAG: molecular chaperone HtpG [Thermoanaerobaculia bacterium]|nr:molecular chaperone HtpG [Thermoanaerobaculia bacterium]
MTATVETRHFQAETRKLLDLMIHSLYTNKEIFLRELISNASDALDRLRFEALTNPELLAGDEKLEIRLESQESGERTLTIHDNGIGMSREEVVENIGTIAKSGTRELMEKLHDAKTSEQIKELIGQFGVGFYSAFMVADKVTLVTRRAGEQDATLWESVGDGTYTLAPAARTSRGTSITLHLKDVDSDLGVEDYTDQWTCSRIVKRYSDFVSYPIIFKHVKEVPEKDEEGKPREDGKTKTIIEDRTLNSMKPIWTRPEAEVTKEEYNEFFKHISHDWNEPLKALNLKAEGRIEYQALLFIPSQAPYDLYYHAYEYGLQLYVRRVMIMDRCEDLVPRYLRFIKGVVDSDDLPLNISRQRLQEDRHIGQIRKWLTKKVLDALADIKSDDEENYFKLWEHFGKAIKEGLSSDFDNKDKLLSLTLFASSADAEKLTTLADYKARMKEDQEEIYYLTGESRSVVENSPHLEAFLAAGYEVIFMVDPVDELVIQHLNEFDGKRLKSVEKMTVKPGTKEEKAEKEKKLKELEEADKDLLDTLQKHLDEEIKQVRISGRLTTSPACLVGADHDYSPQLEKLLQKGKGGGPKQRRILELNPEHEIFKKLEARFQADKEDPVIKDYAELLKGYGQIAEGSEITKPVLFSQLLASVLAARL